MEHKSDRIMIPKKPMEHNYDRIMFPKSEIIKKFAAFGEWIYY